MIPDLAFGKASLGAFGVLLSVHQFGDDFSFVASRVVVIGVLRSLLLGPLLARMAAEHGLILVIVVMLILVEMLLRHFPWLDFTNLKNVSLGC